MSIHPDGALAWPAALDVSDKGQAVGAETSEQSAN
jgi:hypothetical protein